MQVKPPRRGSAHSSLHTLWNPLWKDAAVLTFAAGTFLGLALGFFGLAALDNWLSAWPE